MKKLLKLLIVAALAYGGYRLVDSGRVDLPVPGGADGVSPTPAAVDREACVDVNSADDAALQGIVHVTPQRAHDIRRHRLEEPFTSLDDLSVVPGLGAGRIGDIRAQGLACVK